MKYDGHIEIKDYDPKGGIYITKSIKTTLEERLSRNTRPTVSQTHIICRNILLFNCAKVQIIEKTTPVNFDMIPLK